MAFLRVAARWPASCKFACATPGLHGHALDPPGTALRSGFLPLTTSSAVAKSSAATTAEAVRGGSQTLGSRRDPLDASFDDAHAAYKSKTTWEILRAYIVYTLCSSNYLVENNMKVRIAQSASVF